MRIGQMSIRTRTRLNFVSLFNSQFRNRDNGAAKPGQAPAQPVVVAACAVKRQASGSRLGTQAGGWGLTPKQPQSGPARFHRARRCQATRRRPLSGVDGLDIRRTTPVVRGNACGQSRRVAALHPRFRRGMLNRRGRTCAKRVGSHGASRWRPRYPGSVPALTNQRTSGFLVRVGASEGIGGPG